MDARRYYIRVFQGGIEKWTKLEQRIEDLVKIFDARDSEQSVYEVANGHDEWFAVAAHKLTEPKKSPEATSVLRIEKADLESLTIRIDAGQFGTTGVPLWDSRHRNVIATAQQLKQLVELLGGVHRIGQFRPTLGGFVRLYTTNWTG